MCLAFEYSISVGVRKLGSEQAYSRANLEIKSIPDGLIYHLAITVVARIIRLT
jgi:hypothetical protein